MKKNLLTIPSSEEIKSHMIKSLEKYWPDKNYKKKLMNLPIKQTKIKFLKLPLSCTFIDLPDWANKHGLSDKILVPNEAILKKNWKNIDWWYASFLLLESCHEREFEKKYGPIHSYSYHLKNWDKRVWEKAWVNRIAIFLRIWVKEENPRINLPPISKTEIRLTHDLDAISKTLPIRIKQSLRYLYNFEFKKALEFFFKKEDWFIPSKLIKLENNLAPKPIINIHAKDKFRGPLEWLLDPSYKISDKKLKNILKKLIYNGWMIGLHPSFFSWKSSKKIRKEKLRVEREFGIKVLSIRQHWLRFSWEKTWHAQASAGIKMDSTLMFNDIPGFRNSAVIDFISFYSYQGPIIRSTVFMDSHKDNYLGDLIDEIKLVNGNADLLWHTHTLNEDYGYFKSLRFAIKRIK
tara:strand:+ start:1276 stop:2490 length:1215 start_codon:yes stop_codon:yes gene_type:complete